MICLGSHGVLIDIGREGQLELGDECLSENRRDNRKSEETKQIYVRGE